MEKYKLTDETIIWNGHTLKRIECVTPFKDVQAGARGGFIESESNLSHEGDCWVYDNAKVWGKAWVSGDATISDNAEIYDHCEINDFAKVCGDVRVCNTAWVGGDAQVGGQARITGNAIVRGDAQVFGHAWITDEARVIYNAQVYDHALVGGCMVIGGDIKIAGSAVVEGAVWLHGNAIIESSSDYIIFKNYWSSCYRYFAWTRSNDMWSVGCFHGTGQELIAKAYRDSKDKGDHYKAYVEFVEKLKELDGHGQIENNENKDNYGDTSEESE